MRLSQEERSKLSSDQLIALAKGGTVLSDPDKARLSRSQLLMIHDLGQRLSDEERDKLSSDELLVMAGRGEVLSAQERKKLSGGQLLALREIGQSLNSEDRARLSSDQLMKLPKIESEHPISFRPRILGQFDTRSLENAVSVIRSSNGFHKWNPDAIATHLGFSANHFNGADLEEILEKVGKDPLEARLAVRRQLHRGILREKEVSGGGQVLYMDPTDKEAYETRYSAYSSGAKTNEQPTSEMSRSNLESIGANDVFVVHGRNERARQSMFTFLRAIGLRPLEWTQLIQMTGKGSPYIGEVLEAGFVKAQAAVVLMTPDDEARLREPLRGNDEPRHEIELTPQPRQNVLLEAGMALGLYPDRTIIVELGRMRPISDILGRHVIRMDDSVSQRQELASRLKTAGCQVTLTGVDWHHAGDFKAVLDDM